MPQHDKERFERLILPYLSDAYTLARYLVRDEHDAQDVVQDSALRALRYFESYRGGDARAWLLSIVRNVALTWRQRSLADSRHVEVDDTVTSSDETDATAIIGSDRERIVTAIHALPDEFREVIVLREIHELSYKEIGIIVGAPIGTVMSRLARARRRLALLLAPSVEEAG